MDYEHYIHTHTHTHTRIIPQCVLGRCKVTKRGPYPLWACPPLPTIALNSGGWVTLQGSGQEKQRRTPRGTLLRRAAVPAAQLCAAAATARERRRQRGQTPRPIGGPGPVRSTPDSFSRPGTGDKSSKSSHNQSWEDTPSSIACYPTAESRLLRGRKRSPAQRWPRSCTTWAESRPAQ